MSEKIYNVTNRSSSLVFYSIPEKNINRQFTAGETKKIYFEEDTGKWFSVKASRK